MTTTGLFGLERSNRNFQRKEAWGKNVFTNALPVSLLCYAAFHEIEPVQLLATRLPSGRLGVKQQLTPASTILKIDPLEATFQFETSFKPHQSFTKQKPEKSDVVVTDAAGNHLQALEIKLTVVPDTTTASRPHDMQSCEIVSRPLMVEQLAVSICASFGAQGQSRLNQLLNRHLVGPAYYNWRSESDMLLKMPEILRAVTAVIEDGLPLQSPMVLHPIWRTVGQSPKLEEDCFDIFVWTNMAWTQLLLDSATNSRSAVSRPQRSLIWLVKMLWDYSIQGSLDKANIFEEITFNKQTDKAASFAGSKTINYLKGEFLSKPRIPSSDLSKVILGGGTGFLAPERRLDAAVVVSLVESGNEPGLGATPIVSGKESE
jgi:hypothetical protein